MEHSSERLLLVLLPCDEAMREQVLAICDGKLTPMFLTKENPADPELFGHAEVIFGEPDPKVLCRAEGLRWLQISWAGADRFIPALRTRNDVTLTNASGAYGVTISEHAISMLLALARRFPSYGAQQRQEVWHDLGAEWGLAGKTALILGTGDLGTALAERLRAFQMATVGFCRHERQNPLFDRIITLPELDAELPKADAVFGCLPGTPETAHLLTQRRLMSMKDDAILINVGRGSLICTEDLLYALGQGKFFGVGLDVMEQEPLPPGHSLWHTERVLLTPHVAGVGQGHLPATRSVIWDIFLGNLRRYLAGEALCNTVSLSEGY